MLLRLRFGALGALLVAATFATAGIATVSAQDASPVPTTCVSPGLPPGSPTPVDEGMEGMDMGSPGPIVIPEATPLPEGQPADEATAAAIDEALLNYIACFNEGYATGDLSNLAALVSSAYLADLGYATPYDYAAGEIGSPLDSITYVSSSNHLTYDDGRVSVDGEAILGDHMFVNTRIFLAQEDGIWKWDAEADLKPEPEAETISVNGISINETTDEASGAKTYEIKFLGSPTILQTEALVFNITNTGEELHEIVVAQFPEGADPLGLLDGSVAFEDVTFIGGVFDIRPGTTVDLALMNMQPGVYHMLCFFPGPDGAPHAANGMIAQFEIVAPAE